MRGAWLAHRRPRVAAAASQLAPLTWGRVAPARVQDPELRLVYVACFAVGAYPSAERTYKPFNPILGETFELQKGEMRYIAEQVNEPLT